MVKLGALVGISLATIASAAPPSSSPISVDEQSARYQACVVLKIKKKYPQILKGEALSKLGTPVLTTNYRKIVLEYKTIALISVDSPSLVSNTPSVVYVYFSNPTSDSSVYLATFGGFGGAEPTVLGPIDLREKGHDSCAPK